MLTEGATQTVTVKAEVPSRLGGMGRVRICMRVPAITQVRVKVVSDHDDDEVANATVVAMVTDYYFIVVVDHDGVSELTGVASCRLTTEVKLAKATV